MIPIKRGAEIDKMRRAGEVAAEILNRLADLAVPGISTEKSTMRPPAS
jgi:Methionine aminopeptidase